VKNSLAKILAAVSLFGSQIPLGRAATLAGGPYEGLVRDKATGDPIPGALVMVKWMGTTPSIHSSRPLCYHQAVVMTGTDGRFRVPAWSETTARRGDPTWLPYVTPLQIEEFVFKPAYLDTPMHGRARDPRQIKLEAFNGSLKEWMEFLYELRGRSVCEGDDIERKRRWAEALVREADARLQYQSPEFGKSEAFVWDALHFTVDSLNFGDEEARKRSAKRQVEHWEWFR